MQQPTNTGCSFEKLDEMKLNHLPNDGKLILQRQKSNIMSDDEVQLYFATTFVNRGNNQDVWNKGFSIQLEQIPELIEMLQKTHGKYSGKKTTNAKTEKTIVTFADGVEQMTANEDEE